MRYGDHGIMVITRVCGTCNEGSIPSGRPKMQGSYKL